MATTSNPVEQIEVSPTQQWAAACQFRKRATPIVRLCIAQSLTSSGQVKLSASLENAGIARISGQSDSKKFATFTYPETVRARRSLRTIRRMTHFLTPLLVEVSCTCELEEDEMLAVVRIPDDCEAIFPGAVCGNKVDQLNIFGELTDPSDDDGKYLHNFVLLPPGSNIVPGLPFDNLDRVESLRSVNGYAEAIIAALRKSTFVAEPWATFCILPGAQALQISGVRLSELKDSMVRAANTKPSGQQLLF